MQRRELFLGLAGLLVTPAIVRTQSLMPVSTRTQREPFRVVIRYTVLTTGRTYEKETVGFYEASPVPQFFLHDFPAPWALVGGSLAIREA